MPESSRMATEQTFREAVRLALHDSMTEDSDTIFIGLGATDPGAIFGTTAGLLQAFGPARVFDGPTSENAMTGVGVGAAIAGLKPIMSHQRLDFFLLAMDQLVNSAAKWHYMFGGEVTVPLTIRLVMGRGWGQGPTHSQNLQAWFAHIPGLKVVVPTFSKDAYGLLRASIKDPNPVLFLEHRWLHNASGNMAQDELSGRIDKARVVRSGSDITICATGLLALEALRAAQWLEAEGVSCEVIDLRTLNPIDWETILMSVRQTRRLVVCDPAPVTASVASEIVATATVELFGVLESAPIRLAQPDLPEPTSSALTHDFHVGAADIAKAVLRVLGNADPADVSMLKPHTPHDVPGPWFAGPF
jgi:pyruvate/2-oxoglutarate/acetoin dehydrogenase E1 component